MKEAEVRKLFLVIQNSYSNFVYDDVKVSLWKDLLRDTTFERAQSNLRRFVMHPENKFPPHPGALAESPVERTDSRSIPNAAETRKLLEEMDARQWTPIPENVKQEMRALAARNDSAS